MSTGKKLKWIMFLLWFFILATTARGSFKTCDDVKESARNISGLYVVRIADKDVQVYCNLTSEPVKTTLPVYDNIYHILGSAVHDVHSQTITYRNLSTEDVKKFIDKSVSCKQYVAYTCVNATLFGRLGKSSFSWTSIDDSPKYYWSDCSFADKNCHCGVHGNGTFRENFGYLTNKDDLPVKSFHFNHLSASANVKIQVGNITCYGDVNRRSFTLTNKNAFAALKVSSLKNFSFIFKLFDPKEENQAIASVRTMDHGDIKILVHESKLYVHTTQLNLHLKNIDTQWHTIVMANDGQSVKIAIDHSNFTTVVAHPVMITKLYLGSSERKCNSFRGCIKDMYLDGKDYTDVINQTEMKEFVKEGCSESINTHCSHPKTRESTSTIAPKTVVHTFTHQNNRTNHTTNCGDHVKHVNNDDTTVIAIIVVFLVLIVVLIIALFVTWYLKRHKGVYQTHEGSGENLNWDTENLTLVTKSGNETDGQQGKEYYL